MKSPSVGVPSVGIKVLIARTDRDGNVAVHDQLHRAVARAIEPV